MARQRLGNDRQAITAFQQALALNPKDAETLNNCAASCINIHQFATAFALLNRAIQCDPHFQKAYINFGAAYCALNNYPAALSALQKAVALNPKTSEARDACSGLLKIYTALHRTAEANAVQQQLAQFVPVQ